MDSNSTSNSTKIVSAVLLILVISTILFVAIWVHQRHTRITAMSLHAIRPRLRQRGPLDNGSFTRRLRAIPLATFDRLRTGLDQQHNNVDEEGEVSFPPSARWDHSLDSTDSEEGVHRASMAMVPPD